MLDKIERFLHNKLPGILAWPILAVGWSIVIAAALVFILILALASMLLWAALPLEKSEVKIKKIWGD